MNHDILDIISGSRLLNSEVITYSRIMILLCLEDIGRDGVSFTELKSVLPIEDGTLYSNLKFLKEKQYITEQKTKDTKFEGREITIYYITNVGTDEIKRIKNWMKIIGCENGNETEKTSGSAQGSGAEKSKN